MSNRSKLDALPQDDYLRALGLLTLVADLERQTSQIERSLAELLEVEPDESGYAGHVSDTIYSEIRKDSPRVALNDLLRKLGLEVIDEPVYIKVELYWMEVKSGKNGHFNFTYKIWDRTDPKNEAAKMALQHVIRENGLDTENVFSRIPILTQVSKEDVDNNA